MGGPKFGSEKEKPGTNKFFINEIPTNWSTAEVDHTFSASTNPDLQLFV